VPSRAACHNQDRATHTGIPLANLLFWQRSTPRACAEIEDLRLFKIMQASPVQVENFDADTALCFVCAETEGWKFFDFMPAYLWPTFGFGYG